IDAGYKPVFNLKGYLLGNPVTQKEYDTVQVPAAHRMGLVSDELYEATKESCQGLSADPTNEECVLNIQAVLNLTSRINLVQILEPYVSESYIRLRAMWQQDEHSSYTTLLLTSPLFVREYGYFLSYYWANNETVRDALHVKMVRVEHHFYFAA
ncbi:hypothetical protein AMTR_s00089p00136840, partial [Amborella trichopoda]